MHSKTHGEQPLDVEALTNQRDARRAHLGARVDDALLHQIFSSLDDGRENVPCLCRDARDLARRQDEEDPDQESEEEWVESVEQLVVR